MNPYATLAKEAIENYIEKRKAIDAPQGLPKEMLEKKAGVFVTIEQEGPKGKQLRGCVGTYLPTKGNVAEEIIQNAIAASTEDYRFAPVKKEELPLLSYIIYILNPPEQIKNKSDLDPKKYGILIKTIEPSLKSALLLPDLKGIDTPEQQIETACQKGGINPQKEGMLIYRFKAEKYD